MSIKSLLAHRFVWVSIIIMAFIVVFITIMPKPIDMSLEKVGNGQKAVVFVYDPNLLVSSQQSAEINKARSLVGEDILFLIAKVGDPTGDEFISRHNARAADLLFFNIMGDLVNRETALLSAEDLKEILSSKL